MRILLPLLFVAAAASGCRYMPNWMVGWSEHQVQIRRGDAEINDGRDLLIDVMPVGANLVDDLLQGDGTPRYNSAEWFLGDGRDPERENYLGTYREYILTAQDRVTAELKPDSERIMLGRKANAAVIFYARYRGEAVSEPSSYVVFQGADLGSEVLKVVAKKTRLERVVED